MAEIDIGFLFCITVWMLLIVVIGGLAYGYNKWTRRNEVDWRMEDSEGN